MKNEKCVMIYKIEKDKDILKILDDEFVKNNKNRGKLIINNKKYQIKDFYEIKNKLIDFVKIGIILNKNLYNFSFMFKDCKSLIKFYYDEDSENIENLFNNNFGTSEENKSLGDYEIKFKEDSESSLYKGLKNFTNSNISSTKNSDEVILDKDTVIYFNNRLIYYQK